MRGIWTLAIAALLAAPAFGYQGAPRNPNRVADRVLTDLDRSQAHSYLESGDRKHFENTRKDLLKFQDRWMQGHYDRGKIDSAINNLDHLLQSGRLQPADRERLGRDLRDLRELRARREYNASRRPIRRRVW